MEILGLVPARGGSKGIPNKNLKPLAGQPLITYTLQAAQECKYLTRCVLTTDSPAIVEQSLPHGVDVPFLRPPELAQDTTPTIAVVRHALEWLAFHQGYSPEVVVLLQPTAPLRQAAHIDAAVERLLANEEADAIVSLSPIPAHYHPRWQFTIKADQLQLYGGEPIAALVPRRQDLSTTYTRNGAIYACRTNALERTGTLYGNTCLAYVMPEEVSINLDSLADWERAESYLLQGIRKAA